MDKTIFLLSIFSLICPLCWSEEVKNPVFMSNFHEYFRELERQWFSLECSVWDIGNYTLSWRRLDTNTTLSFGDKNLVSESRYSFRSRYNGQSLVLSFSDLIKSVDEGEYACVINTEPETISKSYFLEIERLVDLSITNPEDLPEHLTVQEGGSIYLHCNVTGEPEPKVDWYYTGDKEMGYWGKFQSGPNLTIWDVSREHEGDYGCYATNYLLPSVEQHVRIDVTFDPDLITNKYRPYSVEAKIGDQDVVIECEARGYPKPKMSWIRNGNEIKQESSHNSTSIENFYNLRSYYVQSHLTIKEVEKADFGMYVCIASSSRGTTRTEIPLVEKESKPSE